jgi:hypothetical protein
VKKSYTLQKKAQDQAGRFSDKSVAKGAKNRDTMPAIADPVETGA